MLNGYLYPFKMIRKAGRGLWWKDFTVSEIR